MRCPDVVVQSAVDNMIQTGIHKWSNWATYGVWSKWATVSIISISSKLSDSLTLEFFTRSPVTDFLQLTGFETVV